MNPERPQPVETGLEYKEVHPLNADNWKILIAEQAVLLRNIAAARRPVGMPNSLRTDAYQRSRELLLALVRVRQLMRTEAGDPHISFPPIEPHFVP